MAKNREKSDLEEALEGFPGLFKNNKDEPLVEAVADMTNVHERQIDDLQMRVEKIEDKLEQLNDWGMAKGERLWKHENRVRTYWDDCREWIGSLCRFRDNSEEEFHYGILRSIDEDSDFPFWDANDFEWAFCEVVKPDDEKLFRR